MNKKMNILAKICTTTRKMARNVAPKPVPVWSIKIPGQFRQQIVLSDEALTAELLRMTDPFTDELFACPGATAVLFPIYRLLVDVERLPDDTREPMSKVGMGMIYTRTADGRTLRRTLQPQEMGNLLHFYYIYFI